MSTSTEPVDLSRTLVGVDASRRVGWAKAFENARQLDEALRDGNIWRGDRDALRRGLSYMFGLFMEWTRDERNEVFRQILDQVTGYDVLLDPHIVKAGRRKARTIRGADEVYEQEAELDRVTKKAEKDRRARRNKEQWARMKELTLERFAGQYGFRDVEELRATVAAWQRATRRPGRTAADLREERKRKRIERRREAELRADEPVKVPGEDVFR